jgi:hypothetical protein
MQAYHSGKHYHSIARRYMAIAGCFYHDGGWSMQQKILNIFDPMSGHTSTITRLLRQRLKNTLTMISFGLEEIQILV